MLLLALCKFPMGINIFCAKINFFVLSPLGFDVSIKKARFACCDLSVVFGLDQNHDFRICVFKRFVWKSNMFTRPFINLTLDKIIHLFLKQYNKYRLLYFELFLNYLSFIFVFWNTNGIFLQKHVVSDFKKIHKFFISNKFIAIYRKESYSLTLMSKKVEWPFIPFIIQFGNTISKAEIEKDK